MNDKYRTSVTKSIEQFLEYKNIDYVKHIAEMHHAYNVLIGLFYEDNHIISGYMDRFGPPFQNQLFQFFLENGNHVFSLY